MKGITKVAPALATGAATALREIGLNKIFGKGITIPKKYITLLPQFKSQFTKSQRDEINRLLINQVGDWLLNQQENKLKVDS